VLKKEKERKKKEKDKERGSRSLPKGPVRVENKKHIPLQRYLLYGESKVMAFK